MITMNTALPAATPEPSREQRQREVAAALSGVLPSTAILFRHEDTTPFECDALTAYRTSPLLVVLPDNEAQVAAVLKICHNLGVPVVARGAGTGLSGGATPHHAGVVLSLAKFNKMKIDPLSCTATVQCGVRNLAISEAAAPYGLYYAPDPSSQIACTIGGNVAENSGGVHCLKYGLTTNNLLGVEIVTINGEVIRIGGKHLDSEGYDLLGIMTGSEGLLGVVTEVTVRILRKPPTARALLVGFARTEDAGNCVAAIIGAGIIPGGMEMMDKPAIHASEAYAKAGYPLDVEALLIVELDGPAAEVD